MKNLAVFTFDQVFFSLETGLMFIPAVSEKEKNRGSEWRFPFHPWQLTEDLVRSCTHK